MDKTELTEEETKIAQIESDLLNVVKNPAVKDVSIVLQAVLSFSAKCFCSGYPEETYGKKYFRSYASEVAAAVEEAMVEIEEKVREKS